MHADAAGAYVSTHDVLLQLLRVKLLALSVVTHKPLVTVGDVKTTVQCTLQKTNFSFCVECNIPATYAMTLANTAMWHAAWLVAQ